MIFLPINGISQISLKALVIMHRLLDAGVNAYAVNGSQVWRVDF